MGNQSRMIILFDQITLHSILLCSRICTQSFDVLGILNFCTGVLNTDSEFSCDHNAYLETCHTTCANTLCFFVKSWK